MGENEGQFIGDRIGIMKDGSLIQVGQGLRPPEWIAEVLASRSRDMAAPTFAADGLYFLGPRYDADWGLPDHTPSYDWLP